MNYPPNGSVSMFHRSHDIGAPGSCRETLRATLTTGPAGTYTFRLWSPLGGRMCGCGFEPFFHMKPSQSTDTDQKAPQLCSLRGSTYASLRTRIAQSTDHAV